MEITTVATRARVGHPSRPLLRVHAHVPGVVRALCGFSLFGQAPKFDTVIWGVNPGAVTRCKECADVAANR